MAFATVIAVVLALFALIGAWVAAERQKGVSERLLQIEEERDHARLQVLGNLYRGEPETSPEVPVLVTVANVGSALAGPVSVSFANDAGTDVSYMNSDPVIIKPGETVTFVVYYLERPKRDEVFRGDDARRAGSDFPKGAEARANVREWRPVALTAGYFIRAWDPTTGRNWWYPRPPENEPAEAPVIH
jgi:hypothetical protein